MSATLTLDDLPVLDSVTVPAKAPKPRKPTKVQTEESHAVARAYGIAQAERMYFLNLALKKFSFDEVIELWWKAQMSD